MPKPLAIILGFLFSFLTPLSWSQTESIQHKLNLKEQQKEIQSIRKHYSKLSNLVWNSIGGKTHLEKYSPPLRKDSQERDFFLFVGKQENPEIHPCAWLAETKSLPSSKDAQAQFKKCQEFASTLQLFQPHVRRMVDVRKCGGPINLLKEECAGDGLYSDAVEYQYNVQSAECWLTCQALGNYIDQNLPAFRGILSEYERGYDEERRQKLEADRKKEEERQRKLAIKKDRKRRAKLRGSPACKLARQSRNLCQAYSIQKISKDRLKLEKQAIDETGYRDKGFLKNLEITSETAKKSLQILQVRYEKFAGEPYPMELCDGWLRGGNPEHPVQKDAAVRCGE